MANLGIFTRTADGKFTGIVRTLERNFQLTLMPDEHKSKETAPDYRAFSATQAELGAGWTQVSPQSGQEYISVRLSDPTFPRAIRANLVQTKAEPDKYMLLQRTR